MATISHFNEDWPEIHPGQGLRARRGCRATAFAVPKPPETPRPVMSHQAPILLADDDENDIFLIRRAFERAGSSWPLMVVRNGREAIDYLKAEGCYADRQAYPWPCLLLLDLKMPLLDGFEVLTWLLKRRRRQPLRVVVLSSSQQDADIQRAFALGADAYCAKPHDFHEMVGIACELHQQLHQLPSIPSAATWRRSEERW